MNKDNPFTSIIDEFRVDQHDPVPLYHQIYLQIRKLIVQGTLTEGDSLPYEKELIDHYGVGRHTVRKALEKLSAEGLIESFPGRGTFIRKPPTQQNFYIDRSFTQQMADLGLEVRSIVVEQKESRITEDSPQSLHNKLGSPCLQLNRVRCGGELALGFQKATILLDRCPGLEEHDFNTESLYCVISTDFHLEIGDIHHQIGAGLADREQAETLGVEEGTPILLESSTTYLVDGEPIESTLSYYRADEYRYNMRYRYRK
jgi:GntR family transcriptional regulator